ncbi:hypothetical protein [Oceanidesulfovibrio marinus]|uniref:AsmA-like C-terminal domain-containing protein n=1 Tax=Oceanidesulfovibrio marinus TaxID=370038 RepID=A0ABX6NLC6_9BACT|nr:hypothetical protein [Oceanidesulfovibrio marinus]QJT11006.1 hypothetical protein E8L03_19735 [Oceanidesulfovibrio marinus]
MPRPSENPPPHHPLRPVLAAVCVIATVAVWVVVLTGAGVAVLLVDPASAVPYAVRIAAPGSTVHVERFEVLSAWPPAVAVHDLTLDGSDGERLFAVDRAIITTDLAAGWEHGLWIEDMELDAPRVTMRVAAEAGGEGGGSGGAWQPDSLRGLFFYKRIRCEDGAVSLSMGNRTVEVRDLSFRLEPRDDADFGEHDPSLRTASLNATARVLEQRSLVALAQVRGEGAIQADRLAMTTRIEDGLVNMGDTRGEVQGRVDLSVTPSMLTLERLALELTPSRLMRRRTGLQGAVRMALSGTLALDEQSYALTAFSATMPGILELAGNATGHLDGLPERATLTADAPDIGLLLDRGRTLLPALRDVQARGGSVRAVFDLNEDAAGVTLEAQNATVTLAGGETFTGRDARVDATVSPRPALQKALLGKGSLDALQLAGMVSCAVDGDAAGWGVTGAELSAPIAGTAAAPAVQNATLRLPSGAIVQDGKAVQVGAVTLTADAAWDGAGLNAPRFVLEADGLGVVEGSTAWHPDAQNATTATFSGQGLQMAGLSKILDSAMGGAATSWSPSGTLDLEGEATQQDNGLGVNVRVSGASAAFSSPDGDYLADKVRWSLNGSGTLGDSTQFDTTFSVSSGQLLLGVFFLDAGVNPVHIRASGKLSGDAVQGLNAECVLKNLVTASYRGRVSFGRAGGPAYNGAAAVTSNSLGEFYSKLVDEPFSASLPVLSDYTLGGSMKLDAAVQGKGADVQAAGMLSLTGASFDSSATSLHAQDVSLKLPIAYGREPRSGETSGSVRIGSAQSPFGQLQNLRLTLGYSRGSLRVSEPVSLPVLGGDLDITNIAVENPYSPDFAVTCNAVLNGAQFNKLDLGGVTLEGGLAGSLGTLRLTRKRLDVPGALGGKFFGGIMAVHDMAVVEPLAQGRRIHATIGIENVDLEPFSEALDIGRITGRMNVVVDNLVLAYGQPSAFALTAKSVEERGVGQTISLKAVNAITLIGTGSGIGDMGVGIFGSFFKEFSYGEIGMQLSLANDVFKVRGLIEEDGVEYLIKKPPLFGINVINRTPGKRVSFSDMLERLSRVTAGGSTTETEFGAGGASGATQGE